MSDLMDRLKALKTAKGKGEALKIVQGINTTPEKQESPIKRRLRLAAQAKQEQEQEPVVVEKPLSLPGISIKAKLAVQATPTITPVVDELAICEYSNKELQRRIDNLVETVMGLNKELEGMKEVEAKLNALVERIAQLEGGANYANS